MKIGVYVGSFNPPHKGHIGVINHLLNNKIVDKILVIPTGNYWDKTDLIDIKDRINMFKLYENEKIIINDKLNDLPYTYMILEELRKDKTNEYNLIIGSDNVISFHKWKHYEEILSDEIIVLPREKIISNDNIPNDLFKNFHVINDFNLIDISSTRIRELILSKKYDDVLELIDEQVLNYIIKNNLYCD